MLHSVMKWLLGAFICGIIGVAISHVDMLRDYNINRNKGFLMKKLDDFAASSYGSKPESYTFRAMRSDVYEVTYSFRTAVKVDTRGNTSNAVTVRLYCPPWGYCRVSDTG